jgi:hypothetical protein
MRLSIDGPRDHIWELFDESFRKISAKISDINLIKTYISEFEM